VRREFIERVRTKGFWIGTALGPILFAGMILLPAMLMRGGGSRRIVVLDGTHGPLGQEVTVALDTTAAFDATRILDAPGVAESLTAEVEAKRLQGFLVLPADLLESASAEYRASNVSGFEAVERMQRTLRQVLLGARLERAGVDPAIVARATPRVHLETRKIAGGKTTGQTAVQSFAIAYIMAMVLFMSILLYGAGIMSSVLEEKSSKVVEVLVSSLRPFELLAGKLIGAGAVSLVQFGVWGASMQLMLSQRSALMSRLGSNEVASIFQLPPLPLSTAVIVVAFFLGGFMLYAAMYAAVGAMSSNLQEAQQAVQPVNLTLMVGLFGMFAMLNNPTSTVAMVLSFLPFTAPIIVPVRWTAGNLPWWEVGVAFTLLLLGVAAIVWVAGRIFRVGILMTGKRPSMRELVRWVRTA
jgi:ABC-2 type transport system permease protein